METAYVRITCRGLIFYEKICHGIISYGTTFHEIVCYGRTCYGFISHGMASFWINCYEITRNVMIYDAIISCGMTSSGNHSGPVLAIGIIALIYCWHRLANVGSVVVLQYLVYSCTEVLPALQMPHEDTVSESGCRQLRYRCLRGAQPIHPATHQPHRALQQYSLSMRCIVPPSAAESGPVDWPKLSAASGKLGILPCPLRPPSHNMM